MTIEINTKKINRLCERAKNKIKKLEESNQKVTDKFIKETTEGLEHIARTAVDEFYDSYTPHTFTKRVNRKGARGGIIKTYEYSYPAYDRTGGLYHAYSIRVDDENWEIKFSSKDMPEVYRVSADYIFENSFVGGYHGGATGSNAADEAAGYPHPNPGVPYWRIPTNGMFSHESPWKPALKTTSPYTKIVARSNDYMEVETLKYNFRLEDNYKKSLDEIIKIMNEIRKEL